MLRKILTNKKGMTLTELLVGSIMLALFAIAISAILTPMVFAFMRANDFAEYNGLLDSVGNQISSDLVRATGLPNNGATPAVDITGASIATNEVVISVAGEGDIRYTIGPDGTLRRNNIDVFPEGYQRGKLVGFVVREVPGEPGCFSVEITIRPRPGAARAGMHVTDFQSRIFFVRPLTMINDPTS